MSKKERPVITDLVDEPVIRRDKIRISNPRHNRPLYMTLWIVLILGLAAFYFLDLDLAVLIKRIGNIPRSIQQLSEFDASEWDVTLRSLLESLDVAILATFYSVFSGIFSGRSWPRTSTPISPSG